MIYFFFWGGGEKFQVIHFDSLTEFCDQHVDDQGWLKHVADLNTEENPEDVKHTNPLTTHPPTQLNTTDNTTYYHGPQTTPQYLPINVHPTSH